jgi:hypothetical protein
MSSENNTIPQLIRTWKVFANKALVTTMREEMDTFLAQCKQNASASLKDVVNRKGQILQIWVDLDWRTAKKNNPHWKSSEMWQKRFNSLDNHFNETVKEIFREEFEAMLPASAPKAKPALRVVGESYSSPAEDEYYSQFKQLKSVKDIIAHRNKHLKQERGE